MGTRHDRLVSQWYGTSVLKVLAWTAALLTVAYLARCLVEFVASAAKVVAL